MAGKIRNENTEISGGESLSDVPHDAFVGGKAMKKDHIALRLAGNRLDDVGAHAAATGGGDRGLRAIRMKGDE